MKKSLLGLSVIAAVLASACNSNNNTKPSEAQPVSGKSSTTQTTTNTKPVVTCVPVKSTKAETEVKAPPQEEPVSTSTTTSKGKASKSKTTAKKPAAKPATTTASTSSSSATSTSTTVASTKPAAVPSGPVSPNADGTCPAGTEAVVSQPAAKPAATAAATTNSKEPPVRTVKSKDGSFDGEVHGTPAAGSKLAKIQIGMSQYEVERLIGYPDDVRSYITGKAFIPFYFGSDSSRTEWVYRGYGSVAFDSGHGRGVVMMINHDNKIQ